MKMPLLATLAAMTASCRDPRAGGEAPAPPSPDVWLRGSVDERLAQVSRHLRGFDVAMVETGHRYGELWWAGRDRNWPYAAYQLDKIGLAIGHGLERRPKRAASARMLEGPVAALRAAIEHRDAAAFEAAFDNLTATCNACHVAEQVGFMRVAPPAHRPSPIAGAAVPGSGSGGAP